MHFGVARYSFFASYLPYTATIILAGRRQLSWQVASPVEVVVKAAMVGTPKHHYIGIGRTPTRFGGVLSAGEPHEPYVRFDWRNPLPQEDQGMPEELANQFIDVRRAKETALAAFDHLRCYLKRHDLELVDICFFMNEAGDTICAEVSTDNTRINYVGKDSKITALVNSRDKEVATQRAWQIVQVLETPILKYPKVLLSGAFCTGKTTLIKRLREKMGIPKLIDDTTREKGPGERDGFPYHFISKEAFEERVSEEIYHEWVEFNGNYYGVPKGEVFEQEAWALDMLSKSRPYYQSQVPGVLSVFLESPSDGVLIERARGRGDSEEKIQQRREKAKEESAQGFDLILGADLSIDEMLSTLCQRIRS